MHLGGSLGEPPGPRAGEARDPGLCKENLFVTLENPLRAR
jgi:hypothetical protein